MTSGVRRLTTDEALALIDGGVIDLEIGILRDTPLVVLEGDRPDPRLTALRWLPAVIAAEGELADHPLRMMADVVLPGPDLERAAAVIGANPQAAVTLVQVLRATRALSFRDGLTLESTAFASLQAGGEFAAWLAGQGKRVRRSDPSPAVVVTHEDRTARLTLNRPRLRNALSVEMRDALVESLRAVTVDPDIDQVVLAANGPAFCIGGDLAEFGSTPDPATAHQIRQTANVAPYLIEIADRLTVEVHGPVVGAGVELAAFAASVKARPDTTFLLPEVDMGLIPGAGGTVSLSHRIGVWRTAELALTTKTIDADTALRWGLVDEINRT
ncbi:MAG: enoyl-CoA hydratase/isomerase family protein [Acidimicrobiales bacterium]